MKFHAGKRSFSLREDEQTFSIFQRKRKGSFKWIKPPLCFPDSIVSCTIAFLFEKLLWRRLNDKQPAPLQETSTRRENEKKLEIKFFSLIETTTKVSRVKYFSWKLYFESKTINQSMLLKTVLARMKNRTIYQGFPVWWCQLKMQNPAGNFEKVIRRAGTTKILEISIKLVLKRFGTKSFKCCLLEYFLEQLAFRIATLV